MDDKEMLKSPASSKASRALSTLMTLAAAGYAWQLYGYLAGFALLVALWVVRRITANLIIDRWMMHIGEGEDDPDVAKVMKQVSRAMWAWVVLAFAGLAISAAEICAGQVCRNIWQ